MGQQLQVGQVGAEPNDGAIPARNATLPNRQDDLAATLGIAYRHLAAGRFTQAERICQEILTKAPHHPSALHLSGRLAQRSGHPDKAVRLYGEAVSEGGTGAELWCNLGEVLLATGRHEEAGEAYSRALSEGDDSANSTSGLLGFLACTPDASAQEIKHLSKAWGRQVAQPESFAHAPGEDAAQILKVGYLVPNPEVHAAALHLEPILVAHDPNVLETVCYADIDPASEVASRQREIAGVWRSTLGVDDRKLAEMVRMDDTDILVDLTGHRFPHRLGVLAMKPAPLQLSWLGNPNTTGLETVDYRLSDDIVNPDDDQRYYLEGLIRLAGGMHAFRAPGYAPNVAPSPARTAGCITYGSFNELAKMTSETIDTWAQILGLVPKSRMIIKSQPFCEATTRKRILAAFEARGVEKSRIDLVPQMRSGQGHLRLYARVDIALDTFPYTGRTSTCEALWMGVPVVTLKGDRATGRLGASLLTSANLEQFIADSKETYIASAVALGQDLDLLAALRSKLRPYLEASPLCDRTRLTREIEKAYRLAWRLHCQPL